MICLLAPSWVGLNLYVLTLAILTVFQWRVPTLFPKTSSMLLSYTQPVPVDSGSPQKASMAHDSKDILDAFAIVVWLVVLMLVRVAVALPCPQPRRVVRQ
jgi:hypothetical protein